MPLARGTSHLLRGIIGAFVIIALTAAYWAIAGPNTIYLRDDNPRLVEAEAAIQRGLIADRNDVTLAETVATDNRQKTRRYPHIEASSFLGYSSLRYGVGGAEAAYNTILRGDDLTQTWSEVLIDKILHRPQAGSDIKVTLDLQLQQVVTESMAGQTGAVVVLAIPSGEVLSLVSMPDYDPNTLNTQWDALVASPDKPFFNRALQGGYQPGGTLQTPLMAAALVAGESLTGTFANATDPVQLDDLELHCALRLPQSELSLRDAYAFACPQPFVQIAEQLGSDAIQYSLTTFQLNNPPRLEGFVSEPPLEPPTINVTDETLIENAVGQGELTVTPLEMATIAGAIINDGNAPRPFALLATRPPDTVRWQEALRTRPTIPYTTQQTARQLQDLMRNAVANGGALNAARPGIDIGGHATLAYSGDATQAWFIGFATLEGNRAVAVAVVLENSADPGLAADIGGETLATAHQLLRMPQS